MSVCKVLVPNIRSREVLNKVADAFVKTSVADMQESGTIQKVTLVIKESCFQRSSLYSSTFCFCDDEKKFEHEGQEVIEAVAKDFKKSWSALIRKVKKESNSAGPISFVNVSIKLQFLTLDRIDFDVKEVDFKICDKRVYV